MEKGSICFFLAPDLAVFKQTIAELEEKIRACREEMNITSEENKLREHFIDTNPAETELRYLSLKFQKMKEVEERARETLPATGKKAGIGSIVTLVKVDRGVEELVRVRIGSFIIPHAKDAPLSVLGAVFTPRTITEMPYSNTLPSALMGKEEGETTEMEINKRIVSYTILDVQN